MQPSFHSAEQLATAPSWIRDLFYWADAAAAPGSTAAQLARFTQLESLWLTNPDPADHTLLGDLLTAHPALHTLLLSRRHRASPLSLLPLDGSALFRGVFDTDEALDAPLGRALAGVSNLRLCVSRATPEGAAALAATESLDLVPMPLSSETFAALASLPRLRSLRAEPGRPDALIPLADSRTLERLAVSARGLTAGEARALAAMPGLRSLDLTVASLADADALAPLASSSARIVVRVSPADAPAELLLQRLAAALPTLPALALDQPSNPKVAGYTPDGMKALAGFAGLRWLTARDLRVKGLKPAHLACLAALPDLAHLSISGATAWGASVTEVFRGLGALRTLVLSAPLSDASVKHLAGLSLERLDLADTKLGVRGVAALGSHATLRELTLGVAEGGFTDAGLGAVANYPRLKYLALVEGRGARVMPTTLAPIAALPALQTLSIPRGGGRDAWADSLAAAPRLEELSLSRRWSPGLESELTAGMLAALLRVPTLQRVHAPDVPRTPEVVAALVASGRLVAGYGETNPDDPMLAPLGEVLAPTAG